MTPPMSHDGIGLPSPYPLSLNTDLHPSPLSLNPSEGRLTRDDQHETNLQQCWDKEIAKRMELTDGYRNVFVLVIKWHDDIDQLGVREEVSDITNLFENVFNYEVTKLELEKRNPQVQLEKEVLEWVYEHDSAENLLMVYYGGHGTYDILSKVLEFRATNEGDSDLQASWNEAERILVEKVKADVFTIMDCCYASDLVRNVPEYGRTFEMLAASNIGLTTAQPGKNSFTRCLINKLEELANENAGGFFTTRDLHERLQKGRTESGPALWRRMGGSSRHIRLRKFKPRDQRTEQKPAMPSHSRFLHLGFALKNEIVHEVHIKSLTKRLPDLFVEAGVPLVDIRWLGCRKVGTPKLTFGEVARFVVKNHEGLSAISPPSTERKRSADEAGLDERP